MSKKLDKFYVSEIDKQLAAFDKLHPKSTAQQAEINKYQRIHQLRDHPTVEPAPVQDDIWRDF